MYISAADSMDLCLLLFMQLFLKVKSSSVQKRESQMPFGTNRKRVCDFLLVRHSNFGPILHRFRDIAVFLCSWPYPYSTLFRGCFRWIRSPLLRSASASTLS